MQKRIGPDSVVAGQRSGASGLSLSSPGTYSGKTVKQTKQDRDKTKGTSVSRYIAFSVVF
jgi:hypothetical protein